MGITLEVLAVGPNRMISVGCSEGGWHGLAGFFVVWLYGFRLWRMAVFSEAGWCRCGAFLLTSGDGRERGVGTDGNQYRW